MRTKLVNCFFLFAACLVLSIMCSSSGYAQTSPGASAVVADCAAELKTYCAQVSPGNDRPVACLIAFEDKISSRCRMTAYLASGFLSNRMKALVKMAKTCSGDILQYCSQVQPGGGRIYDCLKTNKATLLDACRKALPSAEGLLKD